MKVREERKKIALDWNFQNEKTVLGFATNAQRLLRKMNPCMFVSPRLASAEATKGVTTYSLHPGDPLNF